jgi:hypothetical protein
MGTDEAHYFLHLRPHDVCAFAFREVFDISLEIWDEGLPFGWYKHIQYFYRQRILEIQVFHGQRSSEFALRFFSARFFKHFYDFIIRLFFLCSQYQRPCDCSDCPSKKVIITNVSCMPYAKRGGLGRFFFDQQQSISVKTLLAEISSFIM